jgi:hypothetical protein
VIDFAQLPGGGGNDFREPRPNWHRRFKPSPRPDRITDQQREVIRTLLQFGFDRQLIAARTGVTLMQVAAVAAHETMGTYAAGLAAGGNES